MNLYCGPDFIIHFKYSYMMNIVFMTFMFGAGMPILFPIALGSVVIFYIVDRLSLPYSAKRPPVFDHNLNKSVIAFLLVAPIVFCSFGYWMLTNIQIFSNNVVFRDTFNAHIKTGHKLPTLNTLVNQGLPLIIGVFIFIGVALSRKYFAKALLKRSLGPELADLLNETTKTEEHSIFETMKWWQKRKIIKGEKVTRRNLQFVRVRNQVVK